MLHSTISNPCETLRVPIVRPDPNASAYRGPHSRLGVRIFYATSDDGKRDGWYYQQDNSPKSEPYLTSEAAYNAFHQAQGWERV